MIFECVFKSGILKYLEKVKYDDSLWEGTKLSVFISHKFNIIFFNTGECFVFDERVSVKHNLELGEHEKCYACRCPISIEDKASHWYKEGVSCANCYTKTSEEQKIKFSERQRQIYLAREEGRIHLGKIYDIESGSK